jgi:hypothetical protein
MSTGREDLFVSSGATMASDASHWKQERPPDGGYPDVVNLTAVSPNDLLRVRHVLDSGGGS